MGALIMIWLLAYQVLNFTARTGGVMCSFVLCSFGCQVVGGWVA